MRARRSGSDIGLRRRETVVNRLAGQLSFCRGRRKNRPIRLEVVKLNLVRRIRIRLPGWRRILRDRGLGWSCFCGGVVSRLVKLVRKLILRFLEFLNRLSEAFGELGQFLRSKE